MKNLFVVGIASSAGGLKPMKELITEAICHHSMSYVLVPHLQRDHVSTLPHILKSISDLTICTIEDGLEIKACHLYVLPAGYYARVIGNKFVLDKRPDSKMNFSANIMFKSLAESFGRNSIGVVLSGAAGGKDGLEGVKAIKEAGGHTFAQTPSTCDYPQMPMASILSGNIDTIVTASEIGQQLGSMSWAEDEGADLSAPH